MRVARPQFWGCLVGALLGAASPVVCKETAVSPQLSQALQELRASATVWRDNDTEFRSARRAGKLPGDEVGQFAEFVAELKRQVLEECQAVRELGGERFLEGFDCSLPKQPARPLAALPAAPEAYRTEAEEVQSLDDELRKIEGEIDVFVKNKMQNSRPAGNTQHAGARSRLGNAVDAGAGEIDGIRKAKGKKTAAANGGDGDKTASRKRPSGVRGNPRNTDPGAGPGVEYKDRRAIARRGKRGPGGDDDDVLAAQLREAAEKETDSVLKEKLWAEYRKYKASRR